MPGCAVGGWNTLWICRGRLDDAGASPTIPQGLQQQISFSMREEDLGDFSAGSMRQREHLDEATVACWVTFCAEAIRLLIQFVALQSSPSTPQHSLPGGRYPLPGPDFHRLERASFPGARRVEVPGTRH